jgi:hypothetical protein
VLQAAWDLDDRGELTKSESDDLRAIGLWLDRNLPKPDRFSRKRNHHHRTHMALSWFKDTASVHIAKVRAVTTILTARGIAVETITTERPGYIVYEDEFQVVAEPFSDTGA